LKLKFKEILMERYEKKYIDILILVILCFVIIGIKNLFIRDLNFKLYLFAIIVIPIIIVNMIRSIRWHKNKINRS